jgi:hypothetical protein
MVVGDGPQYLCQPVTHVWIVDGAVRTDRGVWYRNPHAGGLDGGRIDVPQDRGEFGGGAAACWSMRCGCCR